MPVDPPKNPAKKGKGKKKGQILGLPWQVVVGGVVVAVLVGLYLRRHASSSGASSSTEAPAMDTSGGGSAGGSDSGSTGAPPNVDLSGFEDALNNLAYSLGGGFAPLGDYGIAPYDPGYPSNGTPGEPAVQTLAPSKAPISFRSPQFPNIHIVRDLPIGSAPHGVKPANVERVQQLRSGATLTTLKGGRVIEQAPGKTPYVVARGQGAPAPAPAPKPAYQAPPAPSKPAPAVYNKWFR